MKYTIELTNKQKAQMDCIIDIVHRYVGFNPKLEMIKTTNVEDTNEYQIGYKVGFEDGKNYEDASYQRYYDKGYNSAINDYNAMIQWLHDCTDDFKRFMNVKYGYDIMYLGNPKVDEGVMLYDLICDHDMAEVISEFQKWQEEKKKPEDESIKVGDVIYSEMTDSKAIIISFDAWDNWNCIDTCGTGFSIDESKKEFWKKIGHFDEVEQLLDKLRGEDNEIAVSR